MRVSFDIGKVFPSDSPVARFVTQLCMVTNDLTLANELVGREFQGHNRPPVSNYFLWLLCSYYREAAKFLDAAINQAEIQHFVTSLPTDVQGHLGTLKASFTPFKGSFVESTLKFVRDVTFHYFDPRKPEIRSLLEEAKDITGGIELGQGTHAEARYEFADEVLLRHILRHWGTDDQALESVMTEMVKLVLALTYFTHGCVAEYLKSLDRQLLTVT